MATTPRERAQERQASLIEDVGVPPRDATRDDRISSLLEAQHLGGVCRICVCSKSRLLSSICGEVPMAGILAWAADVVGGAGASDDEADDARAAASAAMTPEQRLRAAELDARAASLRRAIQDLRLRVPPPHVAQRLPHLHAHSLASSAALALQLNAHSSTKEQSQQREITLQEENAAYEKAISDCQQKIQEKLMEASLLQSNLKEMEMTEHNLKAQLENAMKEQEASQHKSLTTASETTGNALLEAESLINIKSKDLEKKKKELELLDNRVQTLEKEWSVVEEESLKNPSPAQREKVLEKQLHSLIEQLTSKQSQAEILIADVRAKEKELERLNSLNRNPYSSANEVGAARNRSSRGLFGSTEDYDAKAGRRPYQWGARTEGLKRLMILRSAIVLYILLLHIVARLRVQENVRRYARNYAALSILVFACCLYRMPMALLGMLASVAVWEGVRYCRDQWGLTTRAPGIAQALLHCAQIATAILLYVCNLQFALVYAIGLSYAVMMLHASLRKLTPSSLPDPSNRSRRSQLNRS
ncbi:hypothetical protein EJB05_44463, partial [Eragrostis curvula]